MTAAPVNLDAGIVLPADGVDRSPLPPEFYQEHWGDMPQPKFSTRRDFNAPTLGTRQGKFAKVWIGHPNIPFQQYVADVAGELRQNELGLWVPRYRKVVLLAQRQVGKSHMTMTRKAERCFSVSQWRSWYTAQTGQDARDQFLKFYEEYVEKTPLGDVVKIKRGKGDEVMVFPNGSTIRPHPPTEEKLHGKQSDDNDIDEAWAFDLETGKALMQAGAPTKLTRPHAQTWILSAGGTAESTWLASLVAAGRNGSDPDTCYIEFGIPDDADAMDLDVIAEYHPAYGHTVTMDALRGLWSDLDADNDPAGWARAAGNRWTEAIGGAIPATLWGELRWKDDIPEEAPVGYGTARAADGSQVAIAAAADVGGVIVVEILDVLPTAHMSAQHVNAWATDGPIGVAKNGPSAGLADALDKLRPRQLLTLTQQEEAAAVANFLDALPVHAIKFKQNDHLDAAAEVAATRTVGDGGKAWSRTTAAAPVATLEAATAAVWALQHRRVLAVPTFVRRPR